MFNFFNKKDKELIFWTTLKGFSEVEPPVPAIKKLPPWFKNMPSVMNKDLIHHPGTIKKCPGFVDFFKYSYILTLWCDLYIKINDDNSYVMHSPEAHFKFEMHFNNQFIDNLPDTANYTAVVKGISPWKIKTPKKYSILQLPVFYHFNKNFSILPGVIDTDIHHEVNPQIAFHTIGEFFIERGTPLCMFIPFQRKKWNFKILEENKYLSYIDSVAYHWFSSKFQGGYKEHQNKIKGKK